MNSALVLGAGIVGVSAGLHLQRRGWSVVLVDRRNPGEETSYGNAGIIQSEAVQPFEMPCQFGELLKIALGRSNDVRYSLAALPGHLPSLARYWWNSLPSRHEKQTRAYAPLILQALSEHKDLIAEAGAQALVHKGGYHFLYRDPRRLAEDIVKAEAANRQFGVEFAVLSPNDLLRAEPALRGGGTGALHWPEPWSIRDPASLVSAYVDLFERRGGRVVRGNALSLTQWRAGWRVQTDDGPLDAAAAVVALGPWSPELLRLFGYHIPMVRKRGYHRHYVDGGQLNLPLRDADAGCILAPMTKGIRVTTGAELTSDRSGPSLHQLAACERILKDILDLGQPVEEVPWFGTRPCMPDMLPVIGPASRHDGLWFLFGHGHQGFTLGPATGRLLAELLNNETPSIDPHPYRTTRL